MKLYLIGHTAKYECEKICRIYFPTENFEFISSDADMPFESGVYTRVKENGGSFDFYARVLLDGKDESFSLTAEKFRCPDESAAEKLIAVCMVNCLTAVTGTVPPWGILTGVRPSKLMLKYIAEHGEKKAEELFVSGLMVSPEKAALAKTVALSEKKYIDLSQSNSYSLYLSIPFCPTRCSYCSFVSHSIAAAKKLIPDYVRLLCDEIEYTARLTCERGLKLETVYIGGGTPTSLSADDLEIILSRLNRCFGASDCREFTVEAGRPDTITAEKLAVLKNAGVGRISINPQTFNDTVLMNIGRKHTAADILEKYALARKAGFDNINMDFIAGLPGDDEASFRDSIMRAAELRPENITVHTLALKTSAELVTENETESVCRDTPNMVDFARSYLDKEGYLPYYMYRQSKSVGNLENVGYSLPGGECLYNIYMMEEIHSVIALGGGAVSKAVNPENGFLSRVYNFKYPYEYISRFDEILRRKDGLFASSPKG